MVTDLDVPVYMHPRVGIAELTALQYQHSPFLNGAAQEFAVTLSNHILGLCANGVFEWINFLSYRPLHIGLIHPFLVASQILKLLRDIWANAYLQTFSGLTNVGLPSNSSFKWQGDNCEFRTSTSGPRRHAYVAKCVFLLANQLVRNYFWQLCYPTSALPYRPDWIGSDSVLCRLPLRTNDGGRGLAWHPARERQWLGRVETGISDWFVGSKQIDPSYH